MSQVVADDASDVGPQEGNAAHATWAIKIFRLVLMVLFRLFFRVKVAGRGNVPSTPVIICANHLGWADAFMVLLSLPAQPRIYILGEAQVAGISWFRHFMIRRLKVMIPLDRSKPREALRVMEDVLARGGSLLIFPEGHLGAEEGKLLPLQNGAAHLCLHSGVPLLPVGLTGTGQLWLRRKLALRIGKPIDPEFTSGDFRTRLTDLNQLLDKEMHALLPGDNERPRIRLLRKWLTELL